jgi:uncharacterized protein YhbP (UPF0306 family)
MDRDGVTSNPASYPAVLELLELAAMTLATTGEYGEPHAAPVYFAAGTSWQLYFFSDAHSQHSADLARQPMAAAAIHPERTTWQEIRGLQLRGTVAPVMPGPEWDAAWDMYALKFPFVKNMRAIVAINTLYVFRTHWLRWVDNRQGFGFKKEWNLS